MRFGVQIRATAQTVDLRELGRALEANGFDALYLPEHTHIPLSVRSLFPDDPTWLEACKQMVDPFVALATVAAVTERLLLGTGVCLLPQHDPIVLAKTVATLDLVSNGRVLLGIGAGWNAPEMTNHGVDPRQRWAVMREHALAIRAIWTSDVAEFHGRFVDFDPIWLWPKPVQQPHPPLVIGGEGPHVLDRVLDYGDEWMPNEHEGIEDRITELQRRAADEGREPIPVTIYATPTDPATIERLSASGAHRLVFNLPQTAPGDEMRGVHHLAALIRTYL
ncbi:MAG TPA: LLM class F420-dependent oxidoreductase [Thermomicrobiales bacterium]|nr:LLM class F420-dependent oxidoreductase [Thermomicrobiales bacterium]